MPKKFPYLEELIEIFELDNKQKVKLIELVLLVSSILAAFKLPDDLVGAFMIVVLFSIVYWIILQKDTIKPISMGIKYLISALISGFFVLIVVSVQFINVIKLSDRVTTIPGILFMVYYLVLFFVIWIALSPDFKYMDMIKK